VIKKYAFIFVLIKEITVFYIYFKYFVHRKLIITNSKKMKLKGFAIFLLSFFYAVTTVNAQETPSYKTTQFIEICIQEVFKDQSDALVFNTNSSRLGMITNFLKNNVEVMYRPGLQGKNFESLASIGLNNKYNAALTADTSYDPITFNPLKYNLPMHTTVKKMYRIANTDYILTIYPSL